MLTYYCPHCWSIIQEGQTTCPSCGYILDEFEKSDFEEKLLAALYHPVTERKIMAAQILSLRHSQRALSEFLKIREFGLGGQGHVLVQTQRRF